jgi:demethylmenaquinone methyltransferase/2-methoxy-6-polyprenyl-1,4-benzoquinol methylase
MDQRFTLKIGDHLTSANKKRYYNEQVFTEIAPRYDFITRALSFWRDESWKHGLVAQLPPQDSPLCLDLATGTGDIAFLLAKKYPAGRVIGIDITEKMLMLARRRNAWPNVAFSRQDMARLGAETGSIDIVTGGYALRNAPDLEATLDEINRVMRPGATAAFLDFSRPTTGFAGKLQYAVLKAWTGFWGLALHRNHEVYSYIAESLERYPDRAAMRRLLRRKGFAVMHTRLHFFGITELLVVMKFAESGRKS